MAGDRMMPYECVECGDAFLCPIPCLSDHFCGGIGGRTPGRLKFEPCGKPMCYPCLKRSNKSPDHRWRGQCTSCIVRIRFEMAEAMLCGE